MRTKRCCGLDLKRTAKVFRTIAEDRRLVIVCLLKEQERCVCEIQEALGLPHNLVLHHLNTLKRTGLVIPRKTGKFTYYSLDRKNWAAFIKSVEVLFGMKKEAK